MSYFQHGEEAEVTQLPLICVEKEEEVSLPLFGPLAFECSATLINEMRYQKSGPLVNLTVTEFWK